MIEKLEESRDLSSKPLSARHNECREVDIVKLGIEMETVRPELGIRSS